MALLKSFPSTEIMHAHDFDDGTAAIQPVEFKTASTGGNDHLEFNWNALKLPFLTGGDDAAAQVVQNADGTVRKLRKGPNWCEFHGGTIIFVGFNLNRHDEYMSVPLGLSFDSVLTRANSIPIMSDSIASTGTVGNDPDSGILRYLNNIIQYTPEAGSNNSYLALARPTNPVAYPPATSLPPSYVQFGLFTTARPL